jgi:hypothetical protein
MEMLMLQTRVFDVSSEQRASNEIIQLIRKLRWIGMDNEAEQRVTQLKRRRFQPCETVIAGPCETD